MYKSLAAAAFVTAALSLQGCSTMSSMDSKDMSSTPTRVYANDKASVVQAAQTTITKLGYNLKDTREATPTTEVYFSKSVSAFSWGEVGRVDITGLTTGTQVSVGSSKRSKIQITGTEQNDFAKAIFKGLDEQLPQTSN